MRSRGTRWARAAAAAVVLAPVTAAAFSAADSFEQDPVASGGGGGRIYFTGSPRFWGYDCKVCHIGGSGRLQLVLTSVPGELFGGRTYRPGETYAVQVALAQELKKRLEGCVDAQGEPVGERAIPCGVNTFALEVLDREVRPAGALCPNPFTGESSDPCGGCVPSPLGEVHLTADCTAVIANEFDFDPEDPGFRNGQIAYGFYWRAPPAGGGPVTFHVSAVDGNGGDGTADNSSDYLGDETATVALTLYEEGGAGPRASGCGVLPGGRSGPPAPWLLAGLALLLARRRG